MEIAPKRPENARFARSDLKKYFCMLRMREKSTKKYKKRENTQQVEVEKTLSEFRESRSKISVQFESKRFRETIARIVTETK